MTRPRSSIAVPAAVGSPADQACPALRTRLFHWELSNPILIASGPLTSCSRTMAKMLRAGAGGVVTKTIVPTADTRHCRCHRYGDVLFNRDGYSLRSVEQWESDLSLCRGLPVIANIVADTPEELALLAARVTRAGAEVLELGLSCPTLDDDPVCCVPAKLRAFCRAVRRAVDVPLIVKLLISTSAAGNREMARIARETGMNAISVADTVPAMLLERRASTPVLGGPGGASGSFLKPLVLKAVYDMRDAGLEILGIGGIMKAEDALEYIKMGCVVVQVCTLVMNQSYHVIRPLLSELDGLLASEGTTLAGARGRALASVA